MLSTTRQTIAGPLDFQGAGIHSGAPCRLRILPAGQGGGGILLRRGDLELAASLEHADADASQRRTVLKAPGGQTFEQFEHVMAALAGSGVTDAVLVQEGPEPPFLDGGAAVMADAIATAGLRPLGGVLDPLVIDRATSLAVGDAELVATPHDGLRISCFVEYPGTVVGSMGASLEITPEVFRREIAPARTFAAEAEIDALRAAGFAKGGNLQNAVVFNAEHYLNDALHFADEVPRHKVLDLVGDLALIGRPVRGHLWAWRAGHGSHIRFAEHLVESFPS